MRGSFGGLLRSRSRLLHGLDLSLPGLAVPVDGVPGAWPTLGEAPHECGDLPLDHNKQKCKMFPNDSHGMSILLLKDLKVSWLGS